MSPCWIKFYGPPSALPALVRILRDEAVRVVYQPPLSLVRVDVLAEGLIARDILCIGDPRVIAGGVSRFERSRVGQRAMVHLPDPQTA